MDSGLLTMMERHTGHFGVRRQLYSKSLPESVGPEVIAGLARGYLPAAALDLAIHRSQTKALRSGESAVAAARVEAGVQVPGERCWYPPSLRSNSAAPLCRRTPKQSGIHKEPFLISAKRYTYNCSYTKGCRRVRMGRGKERTEPRKTRFEL